jgi:GAF domain-containing protein
MKEQQYKTFLPQLQALIEGVDDEISILANISAALHAEFQWFWTGFYIVKKTLPLEGELEGASLHLGPFQGTPACYTIPYGRGVCGTAWKEKKTIVVRNVEDFPGHIACSALSRSEIVVPIKDKHGDVRAVLDIDSKEIGTFDDIDKNYLEQVAKLIEEALY